VLRIYRIPLSTNVERVAMALAYKGVDVEWVDVDPDDRSPVRRVSGQDLVPVLVEDEFVLSDSSRIIAWLEAKHPDPPLYPRDPARRAEVEVFVDWFNRVWKRPPNELDAELSRHRPDPKRTAALAAEIAASRDVFEALLHGREYLFGEFGVADVIAFPFLRFARRHEENDPYVFHQILVEHLALGDGHPHLSAWLDRMEALPRG
jgi:glutathione S-transferase